MEQVHKAEDRCPDAVRGTVPCGCPTNPVNPPPAMLACRAGRSGYECRGSAWASGGGEDAAGDAGEVVVEDEFQAGGRLSLAGEKNIEV